MNINGIKFAAAVMGASLAATCVVLGGIYLIGGWILPVFCVALFLMIAAAAS